MENQEENEGDWVDKFSHILADMIVTDLAKQQKQKQPEKSLSELKKEIKNKSLGELVLELSK